MLELIIICAVVAYLWSRAEKARAQKGVGVQKQEQTVESTGTAQSHPVVDTAPVQKASRRLTIEGTVAFPLAKAGFFKAFGVPVGSLCDARSFKSTDSIDSFPSAVSVALRTLYEEGTAVGGEVMRLINHSRKLEADETLYFALATVGGKGTDYVMHAFVDRTR